MSGIRQSGTLIGTVSTKRRISAAISPQATIKATISYRGKLNGAIKASVVLTGTMKPHGVLRGIMHMSRSSGVSKPKIREVTLLASAWVGKDNIYQQVVEIEGVTENSQVDLTPTVQQLLVFHDKDISFVTENEGGVVTVYAIGQKLTNDYTFPVTITEVEA